MLNLRYPRQTRAITMAARRALMASASVACLFLFNTGAVDAATMPPSARTPGSASAATGVGPAPDAQALLGQWEAPFTTPDVFVHATLMPNGKLLGIAQGSNNQYTLDPLTHATTPVPVATNTECGAQTLLWDGRPIAVGGGGGSGPGLTDVNIFNPTSGTWTSAAPMNSQRWYPTTVELPDGRILVVSGFVSNYNNIVPIPEVYNPKLNTWTQLTSASSVLQLYPFLYVLSDGRVLHAGGSEYPTTTDVLDVSAQTWTTIDSQMFDGGSSVMYSPNRIMKAGSAVDPGPAGVSAATTYVLDMNAGNPAWTQTASMANPRSFLNLTVLPDGKVLASGGESTKDGTNIANAVKPAELWDPATKTWTTMASMQTPRLYHSVATLLPDARVLVAGGGDFPGAPNEPTAEIYSPPYLFAGTRPTISSAPTTPIPYNGSFFVGTPDGANIASVALIAPSAVTHSTNMNQRYVNLPFSQTAGGLTVQSPQNANLAPPGYYMLFIVNTNGVPSVAPFVRLPAAQFETTSTLGGVDEQPNIAGAPTLRGVAGGTDGRWISGAIALSLSLAASASWYAWRRK